MGTALTVHTSTRFLLTMLPIQSIPPLVRLVGRQCVVRVAPLAPVLGIAAIRRYLQINPGAQTA